MAVCYNGEGAIKLKDCLEKKEFYSKFKNLFNEFDGGENIVLTDRNVLQFKNYSRHYFIPDCIDLIKNSINIIDEGQLWFSCTDEDGTVNRPFPRFVMYEIIDGNVYEEILYTRMPYDWLFHEADMDLLNNTN